MSRAGARPSPDVALAVKLFVQCVLECGDNPAAAGAAPLFTLLCASQKRRRTEYRLPPHSKSISPSAGKDKHRTSNDCD
jgi:hypothetical protein